MVEGVESQEVLRIPLLPVLFFPVPVTLARLIGDCSGEIGINHNGDPVSTNQGITSGSLTSLPILAPLRSQGLKT